MKGFTEVDIGEVGEVFSVLCSHFSCYTLKVCTERVIT
jgi:hypothetical protein